MSIKQGIPNSLKKVLIKGYNQCYLIKKKLKNMFCQLDANLNSSKAVYYCPCCDNRFRRFEAGKFTRVPTVFNQIRYKDIKQEVICSFCGSIPRHRILATWFNKHKEELRNKKILYFACEIGIKKWMKRNRISITTADLFEPADLKLNIENTNQPENSWDLIICNHVLEHVNSYLAALHELYRILKPGGTLIVSFPILHSLPTVIEETIHTEENKKKRLQLYGQVDHLRIFGADSKEILSSIGFNVSIIDGNNMDKHIMPVVGPADYDVNYLFLCRKPQDA